MKLRHLLPLLAISLPMWSLGLPPYNEGFSIEAEPEPDPVTGMDVYNLSWIAREGALYTLEASLDLRPPWFVVRHVPQLAEPDLDEDELVEVACSTDEERLFFRVVLDHGIRLTATCAPEGGTLLEFDVSRWAERIGWFDLYVLSLERASSPDGPFSTIYSTDYIPPGGLTYLDRSAAEGTVYYRVHFTYETNEVSFSESPMSNIAAANCPSAQPPTLTATSHSDRIVLNWLQPFWIDSEDELWVSHWSLRRSTNPSGPFQDIWIPLGPWHTTGMFVDTDVSPGVDYYYYVFFNYDDHSGGSGLISPKSDVVHGKTVSEPPDIGPMDVAFILDNTLSNVKNVLEKLQEVVVGDVRVIDAILDAIEATSGGNYRLALVTTDADVVNVRLNFSRENRDDFRSEFLGVVSVQGGENHPESTDECLNTVVNARTASERPPGKQNVDFGPPFGFADTEKEIPAYSDAENSLIVPRKIVVLITDEAPGGFADPPFDEWHYNPHGCRARSYAIDARSEGIRINAIQIDGSLVGSIANEIMLDYAALTFGWFALLNTNAGHIVDAVLNILGESIAGAEQIPPYLQPCD
jgi:hypothetical protein